MTLLYVLRHNIGVAIVCMTHEEPLTENSTDPQQCPLMMSDGDPVRVCPCKCLSLSQIAYFPEGRTIQLEPGSYLPSDLRILLRLHGSADTRRTPWKLHRTEDDDHLHGRWQRGYGLDDSSSCIPWTGGSHCCPGSFWYCTGTSTFTSRQVQHALYRLERRLPRHADDDRLVGAS